MNTNPVPTGPVNFFMAGGKYISDNLNMQIIDTSQPNAFETYNMLSVMPDLMDEYIESTPEPAPEQKKGFIQSIIEFFVGKPSEGPPQPAVEG